MCRHSILGRFFGWNWTKSSFVHVYSKGKEIVKCSTSMCVLVDTYFKSYF